MPLPSGVQDCRLPGLKPPKRFQPTRRPPRQQLLQLLHAPAICFSGGSRLPFARPQTPQTLPQASKATTLTALPTRPQASKATTLTATATTSRLPFARPQTPQTLPTLPQASKATTLTVTTCPCHLGFKTAVCPASNPPNASNPPAGLQGNNSYSYYMPLPSVFQGVQDCRLPALKPPKPSRRPPRQQLLQLHAPAICFSGGSRQVCLASNPPNASAGFQGNNSYSYTVATTCPCHLFFRGFKTAVCPASNPPNASNPPAGLQGNNAYLTATILHAPAICFSGGSRLPFARPQTPQTLPQASQATTLTATCPCHRFYFSRGSRLPFAWLQTLQTLPQASKATTLTATYMPLPSVFQGVQARPHTLQTLPQASKATTLTATCPCHLFFRGFTTSCLASNPPNASAGFQGNNSYSYTVATTCPCHLFFRGFKTAVCPPSNPPNASNPSAGLQGNNSYSYSYYFKTAVCPASNPPNASNPPAGLQGNNSYSYSYYFKTAVCSASNPPNASNPPASLQGNNSYSYYMPLPSGVQDCRLPGLKPPKRFQPSRRPPRQQLLQLLHAPAICFSGGSRLPFARPQTPQTLPQASKATTFTATCPCHLFFRGFTTSLPGLKPSKRFRRLPRQQLLQLHCSYYMPLPSVFQGVQDCRLPGLKPPKRFQPSRRPPRQQLLSYSYYTTCPCHLFFRGFKTAVCPPSNHPNPPAGLPGNNSYSYMPLPSILSADPGLCQGRGGAWDHRRCGTWLSSNAPNPSAGLQGNNSYSYMPLPSVFRGFKTAVCPASNPPNPSAGLQGNNSYSYMPLPSVFQGVHDKFAWPQTLQTLPQASKATTLTATL